MKRINVKHNGKHYKYIYNATPWQVFKFKFFRFVRICIYLSILVGLILYAGYMLKVYYPEYKIVEKEVVVDNLSGKIGELKGELLSEIKACESAGRSEDYGLITFDPNPNRKSVEIPSIGSYQFKKATVIFYYKKLYNKDITGKEAILIALDDEKAGDLAKDIIFTTDKGLSNWINCSNKYKSADKLALIKKLEK